MHVQPIPQGYPRVAPYLIVEEVPQLIEFLTRTFGAELANRFDRPDGGVMHAEVRIGESVIMMGGAGAQCGPTPAAVHVYVEDVDETYRRALEAGATTLYPPSNQFYGDRGAGVRDASGNTWFLASRVETLSEEELARRGRSEMERRARAAEPA